MRPSADALLAAKQVEMEKGFVASLRRPIECQLQVENRCREKAR